MVKQQELDRMYMEMAYSAAKRSHACRRKVGAILVTPDEGRFEGINGMPSGGTNACEDEEVVCEHRWTSNPSIMGYMCLNCKDAISTYDALRLRDIPAKKVRLVTKPECLHAEANAIMKVTRSHASSVGATIYCTLSPCLECSKLIVQAGITRVVYSEHYPYPGHTGPVRTMGLDFLREYGIQVDHLPVLDNNSVDRDLTIQDEGLWHDQEESWRY